MKFGKAGKNKHAEKINLLKGKPALEDTEKQDIRTEDIKDDGIYELELSPSIMQGHPLCGRGCQAQRRQGRQGQEIR